MMVFAGSGFLLVSLVLKVLFLLVCGSKYVLVLFIERVGLRVMVIAGGRVPVCAMLMLVVERSFAVVGMVIVMGWVLCVPDGSCIAMMGRLIVVRVMGSCV